MIGENKVTLLGNLTADPVLRYTVNRIPRANVTVAVNRYVKDAKPGESNTQADFVPCVAWGKVAEFLAKHFHKGSPIDVREGTLHPFSYEKDGKKLYGMEVIMRRIRFWGPPTKGNADGVPPDIGDSVEIPIEELEMGEDADIPF